MIDIQEILHSPFDIDTHKKVFVDYLEVVIRPDGVVEYAVPSHQEKLISVACEILNLNRRELFDRCPEEYYFNVLLWLCNITGYLSIWNTYLLGPDNITDSQAETLIRLKDEELYKGKLYYKCKENLCQSTM